MHPLDWNYPYSITNLTALAEAKESDFIPAEGLYKSLESARQVGRGRYENYAIIALKEPTPAEWSVESYWRKFFNYLGDTYELYGNPFSYSAPRIFIDDIYMFDAQIRNLSTEAGVELFGENREEAMHRTRRSRYFNSKEMVPQELVYTNLHNNEVLNGIPMQTAC